MALQTIDLGSGPDTPTGDTLLDFSAKYNALIAVLEATTFWTSVDSTANFPASQDVDLTAVLAHLTDTANPHSVTAVQVGADPSGSAAAVQASLDAHEADTANPHSVTAVQVGADPSGSAAAVQANLTAHEGATDPHNIASAAIELTNKTIDVNQNTFLNLPAGGSPTVAIRTGSTVVFDVWSAIYNAAVPSSASTVTCDFTGEVVGSVVTFVSDGTVVNVDGNGRTVIFGSTQITGQVSHLLLMSDGYRVLANWHPGATASALTTPTLTISQPVGVGAQLDWNISSRDPNADGGILEFSTNGINYNPVPGYVSNDVSGSHTGLSGDVTYLYRYRDTSTNPAYNPSDLATDSSTTTQLAAPVVQLTPGDAQVDYSITYSGSVASSTFERSTGGGAWSGVTGFVHGASPIAGTDSTGLSNGTQYDYRAQTENLAAGFTSSPYGTASATPSASPTGAAAIGIATSPESVAAFVDLVPGFSPKAVLMFHGSGAAGSRGAEGSLSRGIWVNSGNQSAGGGATGTGAKAIWNNSALACIDQAQTVLRRHTASLNGADLRLTCAASSGAAQRDLMWLALSGNASYSDVIQTNISGGSSTQQIDAGFTPNLALFTSTDSFYSALNGSPISVYRGMIGLVDANGNQFAMSGSAGSQQQNRWTESNAVMSVSDATGNLIMQASAALIGSGVTLTWGTLPATARALQVLMLSFPTAPDLVYHDIAATTINSPKSDPIAALTFCNIRNNLDTSASAACHFICGLITASGQHCFAQGTTTGGNRYDFIHASKNMFHESVANPGTVNLDITSTLGAGGLSRTINVNNYSTRYSATLFIY